MSFYVANDHEILDQFASNKGYSDLINAAEDEEGLDALNALILQGASEDVPGVVADLDRLKPAVRDKEVVAVIDALRRIIKDQDLIVVTQG
jgi:hypothetical protein